MRGSGSWLVALMGALQLVSSGIASAQTVTTQAAATGADLVGSKCFQCHTDSMFRDQRQDRQAWKATIYRMAGRGGLWTQDEINAMADYLGEALGPDVKPFSAESK